MKYLKANMTFGTCKSEGLSTCFIAGKFNVVKGYTTFRLTLPITLRIVGWTLSDIIPMRRIKFDA